MKIYAMSDIHGYIDEFEEALLKIDLSSDNKLILLGDYIHGPDSYAVMDKIINMQEEYGKSKMIALLGNHEEAALDWTWPISEDRFGLFNTVGKHDDSYYLEWMKKLPRYYVEGKAIFVHAGIDEEAAECGYWELGTGEHIFTGKFPAEIGKIENFDMKIVAGHIGTYSVSGQSDFHNIYYDGGSHYYIDGSVQQSKSIPVLMYDTEKEKFYQITENGPQLILPYDKVY